jgi:uncharacterized protein YeaC (DUF1315 family)
MDFETLIETMSPEVCASLKRAIEIGKWPDGRALTAQQKELCMEAVINYEHRFIAEHERVGYIDRGDKAKGEVCDDSVDAIDETAEKPLKWQH